MKGWQRVLAFSTLALTGVLTLLAACDGDENGAEVELPAPGEYFFDVEATIEFTLTEEAVSAAALAGGQAVTHSGQGTGTATITVTETEMMLYDHLGRVTFFVSTSREVGDEVIQTEIVQFEYTAQSQVKKERAILITEFQPSSLILRFDEENTKTNKDPVRLQSDPGVDLTEPFTLQFPDDHGPATLQNDDGQAVGEITSLGLELSPADGQMGEEPPPPEGGETTAATPTAQPTPTPTPAPTEEPSAATLALDCDHRIPGQESDVIVRVSGLQPGQTVSGSVTGPGVIGDGTFSAVANANGTAEARVPIDQFGSYNVTVNGLSGSIEVGDCPQG